MPAVQRQERHQVEGEQGEVERAQQAQHRRHSRGEGDPDALAGDLARDPAHAHEADQASRVALLQAQARGHRVVEADRQGEDRLEGLPHRDGDRPGDLAERHPHRALGGPDADVGRGLRGGGAVRGGHGALNLDGGHAQGRLGTITAHDDVDRLGPAGEDGGLHVGPGGGGRAVPGDDLIARLQARGRRGRDGIGVGALGSAGAAGGEFGRHAVGHR